MTLTSSDVRALKNRQDRFIYLMLEALEILGLRVEVTEEDMGSGLINKTYKIKEIENGKVGRTHSDV